MLFSWSMSRWFNVVLGLLSLLVILLSFGVSWNCIQVASTWPSRCSISSWLEGMSFACLLLLLLFSVNAFLGRYGIPLCTWFISFNWNRWLWNNGWLIQAFSTCCSVKRLSYWWLSTSCPCFISKLVINSSLWACWLSTIKSWRSCWSSGHNSFISFLSCGACCLAWISCCCRTRSDCCWGFFLQMSRRGSVYSIEIMLLCANNFFVIVSILFNNEFFFWD